MNDKFLTVYAVLDDNTQKELARIQGEIKKLGLVGSQTEMPFHISLGSFPTDKESELIDRIQDVCQKISSFEITLNSISSFGTRVLFVEPEINQNLLNLRKIFNNDVNNFNWHAHITLFIDDLGGQFEKAKAVAENLFKLKVKAKIERICMGEFFPKRDIIEENLSKDYYEQKF